MGIRMTEGRYVILIVIGFGVLLPLLIIGIAYFTSGPDYSELRAGLKEKNGLDVKTIELDGDKGQVQRGKVTTEQGQSYPIVVHIGESRPDVFTGKVTFTTQWILGKQPQVAEAEIRKQVENLGFEPATVNLRPNPSGVGYAGEITAKTGEVIDISEELTGPPLLSKQLAALSPNSYDRWIRNTLEKELKEEIASVSEFVPKEKSWATEEAERQDRIRAEQAQKRATLKAAYDRQMEEIRKSGRQPTIGEIGAAQAFLGPEPPPPVDVREIINRMGIGQPAGPQSMVTYNSATAATKSGRVVELEIELQTAPSRGIYLSWREKRK